MKTQEQKIKIWKQEILEMEHKFAKLLSEEGIHKAFTAFAADDAVLLRNNELIKGKTDIDIFLQGQNAKGLAWTPDFIDVAQSGELAYTYGHYIYTYTDANGKPQKSKGVFLTIWKREKNGEWKFVWD